MEKNQQKQTRKEEPTIAPGMENDAIDKEATEEEIERNDYTPVQQLFGDRTIR